MQRWHKVLLGLVGLAVLLFAASFLWPAIYQICEYAEDTQNEQCALYHFGPYALLNIAERLKFYSELLTALGTLAIAGFTWTLWRATTEQGKFNEAALAANRAAFVFMPTMIPLFIIDETAIQPTGVSDTKIVKGWQFRTTWQNSGETQTKHMKTHIDHEFRDSRLPQKFGFVENTVFVGSMMIGPKTTLRGGATRQFTLDEIRQVQKGERFLYVWGWAKYNDIFPGTSQHVTRYCTQVIVDGDPGKSDAVFNFLIDEQGNCADDECRLAGLS